MSDSERELIERAQSGDNRAFDELVSLHQGAVYGLAIRETGSHAEADEIAQATFVKAYHAIGGYRGTGSFKGWLLTICINLTRNAARSQKRMTPLENAMLDAKATEDKSDEQLDAARRRALLRRAVAQLPNKQRLAVELRIYQDLPFAEVARALGGSENAAKVNFHHAVKALKGLLGNQEEAA